MSDISDSQRAVERLLVDTASVPFDFMALWKEVETCCQTILSWEITHTTLTTQSVIGSLARAYVLVYHLVSHPCINTPQVNFGGRELIEGKQLLAVYLKFREVLETHLSSNVRPKIQKAVSTDGSVMETYVQQWRYFLVAVANLRAIFSSLAPAWHSLGFEENPFERIEDLALNNWSQIILSTETQKSLEEELMVCIAEERDGDCVGDKCHRVGELKDVLAMLPDQNYYRSILEYTYLNDLNRHFREKAVALRGQGIYSYAAEALMYIESESNRASKYLTSKKLAIDQLITIMVDENIDFFQSSPFNDWMVGWKKPEAREQIYNVYNLLSRSRRAGILLLEERFTSAVVELAASEIRNVASHGVKDYYGTIIRTYLSVIKSLRDVVTDAFHEDVSMVEAMENGLRHGLLSAGLSTADYKSLAERLAELSSGAFLPAGERTADQLSVEDVVCVYFFLPDTEPSAKEIFLASYQKRLARRLLIEGCNPSLEQQALYLLVQVKQSPLLFACRTMVKAVNERSIFADTITVSDLNCDPIVLPKGSWPAPPNVSLAMPADLQEIVEKVKYVSSPGLVGRHLTLAEAYSFGIVKMNLPTCPQASEVRLKLTLPQICLLRAVELKPVTTADELCKSLGCSLSDCTACLMPLVNSSILQCALPITAQSEVSINPNPTLPSDTPLLTLFTDIVQTDLIQSARTNVEVTAKSAKRLELHVIEAQVVQALKRHGPQTLDEIEQYVSAALHSSEVTRKELKKAMESLLRRQFVAREEDSDRFKYFP